jgi:hypothetical protein
VRRRRSRALTTLVAAAVLAGLLTACGSDETLVGGASPDADVSSSASAGADDAPEDTPDDASAGADATTSLYGVAYTGASAAQVAEQATYRSWDPCAFIAQSDLATLGPDPRPGTIVGFDTCSYDVAPAGSQAEWTVSATVGIDVDDEQLQQAGGAQSIAGRDVYMMALDGGLPSCVGAVSLSPTHVVQVAASWTGTQGAAATPPEDPCAVVSRLAASAVPVIDAPVLRSQTTTTPRQSALATADPCVLLGQFTDRQPVELVVRRPYDCEVYPPAGTAAEPPSFNLSFSPGSRDTLPPTEKIGKVLVYTYPTSGSCPVRAQGSRTWNTGERYASDSVDVIDLTVFGSGSQDCVEAIETVRKLVAATGMS